MTLFPVLRLRRVVAQIAICTVASPAIAQTTSDALDKPPASQQPSAVATQVAAQLPGIIVQGHYDNGTGTSDAASEGVVRGERLTDLPLLRPGEVLETIPGMVVTQHSGDGKANQYFLRGYNLDHGTDFATFIDGVPVNMPTNAHGQGYTDLNYLIPELVRQIDYRKGPYYAQDGDFSSAGSARVSYRDSVDYNLADVTIGGFGYRRVLLAGSPHIFGANAPSALASAGPRLLTALETEEDDGPWTSPQRLRKVNGLVRLSDGTSAKGWSLDGNFYTAHWNSTDQVPLELIQSGQLGRFSALDPSDGGDTGRQILSGEWHNRDELDYTKVSAFVEHYRLQLWSNFTYFELRPATGDQFEQQEDRNIVGAQVVKGWQHTLLGKDSTTELGVQVRHDNINVGLFNTEDRVPFMAVSNDTVSQTGVGLYAQNTTTWTSWFRSLVGVREDRLDANMLAHAVVQNSGNASGSRLSPKMSLILGPWEKTEFFVNAGKGFHSNDVRGVIDKIDSTTGTPAAPVPALVGSRGAELGLRSDFIDGLQTSLALWKLDSDSELVYNADSSIGSTSANGASKRYGLEWNNHMIVSRWILLDADLAWTHARYATNNDNGEMGNYIANAVAKVALLGVTVHDLGPWSGGLVTRYIGGYPLSQDGSLRAPSAIVTNLRVRREITPNVGLTLDVLNLFDRQYYDIAYQQDFRVTPASPVVPSGVTVHPGEPRQVRVGLNVRF
jgi:outer membrane receptor protein involved in Fe transport